ncbi:hypothetical protein OKW39_000703 [Paraburkholderia sp. MM6662-R1]
MSENSGISTTVLLSAVETLFATHPNPEHLRRAWMKEVERLHAYRAAPGTKPDPSMSAAASIAEALLEAIPR